MDFLTNLLPLNARKMEQDDERMVSLGELPTAIKSAFCQVSKFLPMDASSRVHPASMSKPLQAKVGRSSDRWATMFLVVR